MVGPSPSNRTDCPTCVAPDVPSRTSHRTHHLEVRRADPVRVRVTGHGVRGRAASTGEEDTAQRRRRLASLIDLAIHQRRPGVDAGPAWATSLLAYACQYSLRRPTARLNPRTQKAGRSSRVRRSGPRPGYLRGMAGPLRLIIAGRPEDPLLDIALTHALLQEVAAGRHAPALRLFRPGPTVAFGRLDVLRNGFAEAAGGPASSATRPWSGPRAGTPRSTTTAPCSSSRSPPRTT